VDEPALAVTDPDEHAGWAHGVRARAEADGVRPVAIAANQQTAREAEAAWQAEQDLLRGTDRAS
jgi:hypothetical protein